MRMTRKTSLCALLASLTMTGGVMAQEQPAANDPTEAQMLRHEWELDRDRHNSEQHQWLMSGSKFTAAYQKWLRDENLEMNAQSFERYMEEFGEPEFADPDPWIERFKVWLDRAEGEVFQTEVCFYLLMEYSNRQMPEEWTDLFIKSARRWPMDRFIVRHALDAPFMGEEAGRNEETICMIEEIIETHGIEQGVAEYRYTLAFYSLQTDDQAGMRKQISALNCDFPGSWFTEQAALMLTKLDDLAPGRDAPGFEMIDFEGKPIRLSEYRGKIVLLDFWSTTCGPCILAMPELRAIKESFDAEDFVIIGMALNMGETDAQFRKVLNNNKVTWRQARLPGGWEGNIARQYGVIGLPTNVLIDQEGRIVNRDSQLMNLQETIVRLIPQDGVPE